MLKTTIDGILNHCISIEQPVEGFRVAIDTILLAAAVPENAQMILELGCGVGGSMLAVGCRVKAAQITGIELQSELVALCATNIERNTMLDRLRVVQGDVRALPQNYAGAFDFVFMNPPYHDLARHDTSPNDIKRVANAETNGDLTAWVASAAQALVVGGGVAAIHRADRVQELVALLQAEFGDVVIKPILTKTDAPPKRALLWAKKGAAFSMREATPLLMHNKDGSYTVEADAILRDNKAITCN